ncbi:MAG: HupE/UreJ family protein [Bryobacteraceae bacterium]
MRLPFATRLPAVTFASWVLFTHFATAHNLPNDVTVQVFFRPEGNHLRLLVRVPLQAMRDVEFPQRGPGYLDLERVDGFLPDAVNLWISGALDVYEDDARLPKPLVVESRVSLLSDPSFATYDAALAHIRGPKLTNATSVVWDQVLLDTMLEYPIHSDRARFSIHSELARLGLRTVTVLRFLPPGGVIRAFEFTGDPGVVALDPRLHQAALRFVKLGFLHILDGTDHLLFLLCLVIPFRRFGALIPIVTAFTIAHSITLIASAYDFAPSALWFPPLIETLIACSIVYMALENIVGGATVHRRWMIAFGFGLVHGFGFSFALKETLQFAGSHLLTSLLGFNIGVELGQLLVLALLVPALEFVFRHMVAERMVTIILSALVAHTGWHWMMDRADRLRQFRFEPPLIDAALLATALRVLTVAVLLAGLGWAARAVLSDYAERKRIVRRGAQPSGGEQPST